MSKRDDLIALYAADLRDKCGVTPDMDLLTKVTIGCGPAIYNADSSTVAGTSESEIETVKNNFLIKKLGLADGPALTAGIDAVLDRSKYFYRQGGLAHTDQKDRHRDIVERDDK